MSLQLGTAKKDITPVKPIALAGFGLRKGKPFEGISHPIYLRILLLEQDQLESKSRALIVSADLLWWGSERIGNIRRRINERWDLKEHNIILNASHSHSGPQTTTAFPSIGPFDEEYVRFLEESLLEGIELAFQNMEPVCIEKGHGECKITTNRRKKVNNQIVLAPNQDGLVDHDLNVIRFKDQLKNTKALIVNFTGHPVTTLENRLSPEYTGMAMEYLEENIGGNTVAAFLQGCCGDININGLTNSTFCDGKFIDICSYGRKLCDSVMTVLSKPMNQIKEGLLAGRRMDVNLPINKIPSIRELYDISQQTDKEGLRKWAELLLGEPERIVPFKTLELTRLDLAEGLSFLAMNGEMVIEYGLFIKNHTGGAVIPLGYSNGMIAYIPTEKQLEEGGYESIDSIYPFSLPAPFDVGLEYRIKEAIIELLN